MIDIFDMWRRMKMAKQSNNTPDKTTHNNGQGGYPRRKDKGTKSGLLQQTGHNPVPHNQTPHNPTQHRPQPQQPSGATRQAGYVGGGVRPVGPNSIDLPQPQKGVMTHKFNPFNGVK